MVREAEKVAAKIHRFFALTVPRSPFPVRCGARQAQRRRWRRPGGWSELDVGETAPVRGRPPTDRLVGPPTATYMCTATKPGRSVGRRRPARRAPGRPTTGAVALGTGRIIVGQGRSVPGAPGWLVPGPARSSVRGPGPVGSRPLRSARGAARGRAALPKPGTGSRTTTTAPFTVGETGARPCRWALPDQPVPRPRSASTPPTASRPACPPPDRVSHQIGRLAFGPRSLSGARLSGCHVHRVLVRSPPR